MQVDIPHDRLNALARLFERNANQANLALITLSHGAYLEAITDEIVDSILPSHKNGSHATKLRGLRDFPVIDDAAFQAATSFAYIRNEFAYSFHDRILSEPEIAPNFASFVGIMSKRFNIDKLVKTMERKVEDFGQSHFGISDGRHTGFSGEDGERMKSAALFLCIHFLAVRYSLPPKGTPLALDSNYIIHSRT